MSGQKKIMVAKTRGVFTGAALGYALLGPAGAALGAAMNRRQEFYRDMTDEELAAEKARKEAKAIADKETSKKFWRGFWKLVIVGPIALAILSAVVNDLGQLLSWLFK